MHKYIGAASSHSEINWRTSADDRQLNPRQIEHSLQLSSGDFNQRYNTVTSVIKSSFIKPKYSSSIIIVSTVQQ